MLILITGLPGSGKTTIARSFSIQTGAFHLNSDLLRRSLGLMGHYSSEDKEKVYSTLLERAETALKAGRVVVVDSTFYHPKIREPFVLLAKRCQVPLRWVEVQASPDTIRERLKTPRPDSEADYAVYEKIRDAAVPLDMPHLLLKSDEMTIEMMLGLLTEYCQTV
jgi:predicted kinase